MAKIRTFSINKEGKIEFTQEELKKLLDEVFAEGQANSSFMYWQPNTYPEFTYLNLDASTSTSTSTSASTGITVNPNINITKANFLNNSDNVANTLANLVTPSAYHEAVTEQIKNGNFKGNDDKVEGGRTKC